MATKALDQKADSNDFPCVRAPFSAWWGATIGNWRDCLEALTSGDFLSADFFGFAFNDMLSLPLFGLVRDRAAVLEDTWNARYQDVVKLADPLTCKMQGTELPAAVAETTERPLDPAAGAQWDVGSDRRPHRHDVARGNVSAQRGTTVPHDKGRTGVHALRRGGPHSGSADLRRQHQKARQLLRWRAPKHRRAQLGALSSDFAAGVDTKHRRGHR
jgi:hypothetical protein